MNNKKQQPQRRGEEEEEEDLKNERILEYWRSMKMLDKFEQNNTAWMNRQRENEEKERKIE